MTVQVSRFRRVAQAGFSLAAGCACLAVLPSALAAVSGLATVSLPAAGSVAIADTALGAFTPASADPRLLATLRSRATVRQTAAGADDAGMFRFTPAGAKQNGQRDVTVAVRIDPDSARGASMRMQSGAGDAGLRVAGVAPVAFNLGVARGYQSFAQSAKVVGSAGGFNAGLLPDGVRAIDAPDLGRFTPVRKDKVRKSSDSRFATAVAVGDEPAPGLAPRTFAGDGDVSVDVRGSYRVVGNLAVTAGIRYSDERNRLAPLTDGQQDSQSVYVGTRFRF